MIPKIIHYCWFGGKAKPKDVEANIASWRQFFPDYQIIEWNESNTDLSRSAYVQEAFAAKMWAFVSDYVRMQVLFDQGGIYFDTDVEVVRAFPEALLALPAFSGLESESLLVSPGLVFACEPGNELAGWLLADYDRSHFERTRVEKIKTINLRLTDKMREDGLKHVDEKQVVDGLTVFPSNYFCGYDFRTRKNVISPETLSVHHYAASWYPWHRQLRHQVGNLVRRLRN